MDPCSLRYLSGRFWWKSGRAEVSGYADGVAALSDGSVGLQAGRGHLARLGHGVVQFRDLRTQKCVAAVVEGEVHARGWK